MSINDLNQALLLEKDNREEIKKELNDVNFQFD